MPAYCHLSFNSFKLCLLIHLRSHPIGNPRPLFKISREGFLGGLDTDHRDIVRNSGDLQFLISYLTLGLSFFLIGAFGVCLLCWDTFRFFTSNVVHHDQRYLSMHNDSRTEKAAFLPPISYRRLHISSFVVNFFNLHANRSL
ncbi:hypothetical protein K435DRAFT_445983 [Dendrothele bispora CBS 962.96]|uniref:Uncharacterized protein n=1 Tax=Dendrothele bispora (strain CBS 962.96) TaxID=1314807 RepID=A0A4S8L3M8_DENBC|nr:hypothetical protein K435DRAFT_445983 [Dendrothele bispora CBS 962.96]